MQIMKLPKAETVKTAVLPGTCIEEGAFGRAEELAIEETKRGI